MLHRPTTLAARRVGKNLANYIPVAWLRCSAVWRAHHAGLQSALTSSRVYPSLKKLLTGKCVGVLVTKHFACNADMLALARVG